MPPYPHSLILAHASSPLLPHRSTRCSLSHNHSYTAHGLTHSQSHTSHSHTGHGLRLCLSSPIQALCIASPSKHSPLVQGPCSLLLFNFFFLKYFIKCFIFLFFFCFLYLRKLKTMASICLYSIDNHV